MNLNTIKTAELRKMAEEQKIEGYEDMEKEELIAALKPKEEPETPEEPEEEIELNEFTMKELQKMAKERGVDIKGLKTKKPVAEAIKKSDEEGEPEVPEVPSEAPVKSESLGAGIKAGHIPKGSKAEKMLEHLSKQPMIRILIPIEGKERPGTTVPFTLNGLRLNVAKGVYVDVPEQIAEMVMKKQKQTVEALNNPLNLDNPNHPKKQSGEGLSGLNA